MDKPLQSQVALVTGSGRGIGRACALALAQSGCRVVVVARTEPQVLDTQKAIQALGGEALAVVGDIGNEAAVDALFAKARAEFGPVSILVNNAGSFVVAPVAEHSAEDWDRVMATNVRGVFLCTRALFRQTDRPKAGASVVNIASLAGVRGTEKFPGLSSYVASKFAVVGMTDSFAAEGRALGIRVNCIAPGAVDTEMLRQAAPQLRTSTTPEQIARTVVHLADSAQSGHLNGAVIEVFSNLPS